VKDRGPARLVRLELDAHGGLRRASTCRGPRLEREGQEVDVGLVVRKRHAVPSTGEAASSVLRAIFCRVRSAPATGVNSTIEHAGQRAEVVRQEQVGEGVDDLGDVVVEALADARREEGEALEEALDVRVAARSASMPATAGKARPNSLPRLRR
jgi:hypothetical protein